MLGKIKGRRTRGHHRMRWLDGITNAMSMNLGKLREMVRDREARHAAVHGGSKITTDGDCSYEIKRRLLLGRKGMINLDSILKSRDITLLTTEPLLNLKFILLT